MVRAESGTAKFMCLCEAGGAGSLVMQWLLDGLADANKLDPSVTADCMPL